MAMEWCDPPPLDYGSRNVRKGRAQLFVAELKERPGCWAKYPATLGGVTSLAAYRKNYPQVEWTGRKNAEGRCDVYARWVGQ